MPSDASGKDYIMRFLLLPLLMLISSCYQYTESELQLEIMEQLMQEGKIEYEVVDTIYSYDKQNKCNRDVYKFWIRIIDMDKNE